MLRRKSNTQEKRRERGILPPGWVPRIWRNPLPIEQILSLLPDAWVTVVLCWKLPSHILQWPDRAKPPTNPSELRQTLWCIQQLCPVPLLQQLAYPSWLELSHLVSSAYNWAWLRIRCWRNHQWPSQCYTHGTKTSRIFPSHEKKKPRIYTFRFKEKDCEEVKMLMAANILHRRHTTCKISVMVLAGFRSSWHKLESSGRREPHLRKHFHKIQLERIFLISGW